MFNLLPFDLAESTPNNERNCLNSFFVKWNSTDQYEFDSNILNCGAVKTGFSGATNFHPSFGCYKRRRLWHKTHFWPWPSKLPLMVALEDRFPFLICAHHCIVTHEILQVKQNQFPCGFDLKPAQDKRYVRIIIWV